MSITDLVPWLGTVITVCVMVGGLLAMRQGYSKQASDIQERVIAALQAQNETQESQIAVCEKEILRLKRVVATVQYALKRRGLRIEIDGETITLIDESAKREQTIQITMTDKQEIATPDEK